MLSDGLLDLGHAPGITQADADLRYLKLNTLNRPLTGPLSFNADDFDGPLLDFTASTGEIDSPYRGVFCDGLDQIHFSLGLAEPLSTVLRTSMAGLHFLDDTEGDFFIGSYHDFPNFLAQISSKPGSGGVDTDTANWATNLFQGNWGSGATPSFPFVEINYRIGDGSVGAYTPMGEDSTTYILDGALTIGTYDGTSLGGGGLALWARQVASGTYFSHDVTAKSFVIRTMSFSSKAAGQISGVEFAGTRLNRVVPTTDDAVSLGVLLNRWKGIFSSGGLTLPTLVKTGTYTATADDLTILCDVSGGAFTVNLPALASHPGRVYNIKNDVSSANLVTIDGNGSETIDGTTTITVSYPNTATIQGVSSGWRII